MIHDLMSVMILETNDLNEQFILYLVTVNQTKKDKETWRENPSLTPMLLT